MSTSTHHIVVDIYGEQIQVGGQWFHAERIFGRAASTFTVGQPVPELQSARPAPATNKKASDDADEWVQCDLFRESGANVTEPTKIERYAQDMIAYGGWGSFPLVTGRIHCVTQADVDRYQELAELGQAHELAWSRTLRSQDVGTRYIHLENGHHRAHAARLLNLRLRGHPIEMPAHDLEREEAEFDQRPIDRPQKVDRGATSPQPPSRRMRP